MSSRDSFIYSCKLTICTTVLFNINANVANKKNDYDKCTSNRLMHSPHCNNFTFIMTS